MVRYCSLPMLKKMIFFSISLQPFLSHPNTFSPNPPQRQQPTSDLPPPTYHLIRSTQFKSNIPTKIKNKKINFKYCNTKPFTQNQPQTFRITTNSQQKPQLKELKDAVNNKPNPMSRLSPPLLPPHTPANPPIERSTMGSVAREE